MTSRATACSARETAYLRRTADYASDHGIRLVMVVPPMNDSLLRAVGPAGYDQRHADLVAALHAVARGRPGLTVLDYRDAGAFGGSDDGFLDPVHQTRANMRAMTADICQRAALACTLTTYPRSLAARLAADWSAGRGRPPPSFDGWPAGEGVVTIDRPAGVTGSWTEPYPRPRS